MPFQAIPFVAGTAGVTAVGAGAWHVLTGNTCDSWKTCAGNRKQGAFAPDRNFEDIKKNLYHPDRNGHGNIEGDDNHTGLSPRLSHVIETMAGTQRRGDTPKFVPPQFENRQRFKSDSVSLDSGLRAAFSHENRGPNKEQVEIILAQKEYHEQWQQERERKLAEEQARRRALLERERLERDRRLKAEREAINQQRHELERQKRLREQEERQRRLEIEKQREAREAQERSSREARRAAEAQRANEERQRSLDEQKRRVRQEIEAKRAEEERRARAEIQAREAKVQKANARREMEIQAREAKRAEREAAEERQRAAREMEVRRSQALAQEQRQTYPRDHKGIPVVIGDAHAELARQRAEQERQPQRSSPSPAMQGSASRPDLLGSQLGSPRVQTISRATADLLVGSLVQPPSPTSPPRVINPTTPEPWISLTSITSVSEGSPRHQNTWYAPTVTASAIMVPTPRHNVEERLFTDRPSFTTKPKDNSPPRVPSLNLPVTASTVAPSLTPPAGIGISFVPDQDGNLLIAHLVPGGPAQATGNLFVGDRLLSVSGQPVAGKTVPEVIRMVLGPKDSEVRLEVISPSVGPGVREVRVLRAAPSQSSAPPSRSFPSPHRGASPN